MDPNDLERLVEQRLRVLNIICGALLMSLAIYVGIAWLLLQQGSLPGAEGTTVPEIFPTLLTAIAVLTVLGAHVVARLMLAQGLRTASGDDPTPRLNAFQVSVIIGFALRESASVMGLVLTLLTGDLMWVAALSALAAAAMVIAWPRKEKLQEVAGSRITTIG